MIPTLSPMQHKLTYYFKKNRRFWEKKLVKPMVLDKAQILSNKQRLFNAGETVGGVICWLCLKTTKP